jgi:hypothetical protein
MEGFFGPFRLAHSVLSHWSCALWYLRPGVLLADASSDLYQAASGCGPGHIPQARSLIASLSGRVISSEFIEELERLVSSYQKVAFVPSGSGFKMALDPTSEY